RPLRGAGPGAGSSSALPAQPALAGARRAATAENPLPRRAFRSAASVADAFDQIVGLGAGALQRHDLIERCELEGLRRNDPRLLQHLLVVYRRVDHERVLVDAPIPLDDAQRIGMKRYAALRPDPRIVGEVLHLDDERIAFPMPDRVAAVRR